MAKIKGIQLKSVKDFVGREGYGFSANIYLDNKNVGEVLDTANGSGEFEFHYKDKSQTEILARLSKEYFKENPKYMLYFDEKGSERSQNEGYISDMVEELKLLTFVEKAYKKYTKQGFPITIFVEFNERNKDIMDSDYNSEEAFVLGAKVWDDAMKAKLKKDYPLAKIFKTYESLDAFIIA